MKVLFDHQIFYSQRYGGISRYFRELAVRLGQGSGTQVRVVAPFHINEYLRHAPGFRLHSPYFGYHFREADRIRARARRTLLPRQYTRHRDADIVHETYFSEAPFGTGRVRVTTMYDMIYEIYPQYFPDAAQMTQAKRKAVERCEHVICISETTRQDLIRVFGVEPERTSVVYLGFDLVASSVVPHAVPKPASRPFILFVGNRGLYKNFARLAEAFAGSAMLKREFDLVAFGGGSFTNAEAALNQRLGIAGRVRQVGGDDALLADHYRAASAFVFPSLYEGFGIPPLEAMSFGCPVACSLASSIPEVVGDAAAFFDPTSTESIRTTVEHLLGSTSLRDELVGRGRARLNVFSWDRCAQETAALYRRALEGAQ